MKRAADSAVSKQCTFVMPSKHAVFIGIWMEAQVRIEPVRRIVAIAGGPFDQKTFEADSPAGGG